MPFIFVADETSRVWNSDRYFSAPRPRLRGWNKHGWQRRRRSRPNHRVIILSDAVISNRLSLLGLRPPTGPALEHRTACRLERKPEARAGPRTGAHRKRQQL